MSRQRLRPDLLLLVALGGALGATLRHAVDVLGPHGLLPWPTLAVNVVGAFALGALPLVGAVRRSPRLAAALGPGVLGGFTTVSAWAGQTRALGADGHVGMAGLYVLATLGAGLGAAACGRRLSRRREPDEARG